MPLHMTGLISRRELQHPTEKPVAPTFELVLKYNPHHDPETGRFASGGGGRRGGTVGPPTHGYAGQKLTGAARNLPFRPEAPVKGYTPAVNPAQNLPFRPEAPVKGYTPAVNPAKNFAAGTRILDDSPIPPKRPGETVHEYVDRTSDEYDKAQDLVPHGKGYLHLSRGEGVFNPNDEKTHPVGTIYDSGSNKIIVPTTEMVDAATQRRFRDQKSHPVGTSYSSTGTMIPHGEGYFHLESGKVYRSYMMSGSGGSGGGVSSLSAEERAAYEAQKPMAKAILNYGKKKKR